MNRFAVLILVVACGGSSKQPVGNTGGPGPAPASEAVTLKELQNGDRACYVLFTTAKGEDSSMEGDFELCQGASKDASALIGKKVTYKAKKGKVLAASCQGDVDCGKSDEVDVIYEITAAP